VSMKWITKGNSCSVQTVGYGVHGGGAGHQSIGIKDSRVEALCPVRSGSLGDKGMRFSPELPSGSKSVAPDVHPHDTIPPEGE